MERTYSHSKRFFWHKVCECPRTRLRASWKLCACPVAIPARARPHHRRNSRHRRDWRPWVIVLMLISARYRRRGLRRRGGLRCASGASTVFVAWPSITIAYRRLRCRRSRRSPRVGVSSWIMWARRLLEKSPAQLELPVSKVVDVRRRDVAPGRRLAHVAVKKRRRRAGVVIAPDPERSRAIK